VGQGSFDLALSPRRMMIILLLPFLFGNFVQKWYFPRGVNHGSTAIMQIADTDRDTNWEFIFTVYEVGQPFLHFYELHLPDDWEADSLLIPYYHGLYGSGDFDFDGFYDLVMTFHNENPSLADGITIYESPDSLSYPTQEVWRDTIGFPLVIPVCVFDIDEDGIPEIVDGNGNGATDFNIFESVANNTYELIFTGYPPSYCSSTFAFGDYDSDSANEFVFGSLDGWYVVYECNGNNSYVETHVEQLPTANITDCFAIPDADGDGKLEFVVKGYVVPTARVDAFIFEATGDNTYEIVKSFDLFGGSNDYWGGYSDVGDVDGDSIPEIALEACQCIYLIKAAANDSFYVWDYIYGNNGGSNVRVYDLDNNGLAEVIISGNNQTRIYEYQVGIAEEVVCEVKGISLAVSPNPFSNSTEIRCQITDDRQKCELKIYDIAGRLVTDLSKQMSDRSYRSSVRWDGIDLSGRRLPAGVYFLKFKVGDYSTTEKLLLIR
jgi:hypothetical protein